MADVIALTDGEGAHAAIVATDNASNFPSFFES